METKKPVPLEKGIAKFDEKLVIPATLYHDKKKESYIKKEVCWNKYLIYLFERRV